MLNNSDKIAQKVKAIESLGNKRDKNLFSLFLLKYDNESPQIRSAVVQAMRKIADTDSINFFTRVASNKSEKGWIRNSAIEALLELDCRDKLPLFGSILNEIIDYSTKHRNNISYAKNLDEIPDMKTIILALMTYSENGGTDILRDTMALRLNEFYINSGEIYRAGVCLLDTFAEWGDSTVFPLILDMAKEDYSNIEKGILTRSNLLDSLSVFLFLLKSSGIYEQSPILEEINSISTEYSRYLKTELGISDHVEYSLDTQQKQIKQPLIADNSILLTRAV